MGKTIAIASRKGGVGKTTTAVNLAVGLARQGKSVLALDLDPQGSMTVSFGVKEPQSLNHIHLLNEWHMTTISVSNGQLSPF
jgi:chromosome partitioning protein